VDQRFALRATIASRFLTTYLNDLVVRQTTQAERHLSSRAVSEQVFRRTVDDATRWLPWLALLGLAVVSLIAVVLFLRNAGDRVRLAALNDELERLVGIDALTGLSNRRRIEDDLVRAASAARRHDTELSILLIDIDHFKAINDTHGHQAGDRALARTARAMEDALRREDLIGRWAARSSWRSFRRPTPMERPS